MPIRSCLKAGLNQKREPNHKYNLRFPDRGRLSHYPKIKCTSGGSMWRLSVPMNLAGSKCFLPTS
jgi:hypothetical protein